jgi:hypothetical protein
VAGKEDRPTTGGKTVRKTVVMSTGAAGADSPGADDGSADEMDEDMMVLGE